MTARDPHNHPCGAREPISRAAPTAALTYGLEPSDVNRIAMVGRDAEGLMQDFEELGRVGLSSREACQAMWTADAQVRDLMGRVFAKATGSAQ